MSLKFKVSKREGKVKRDTLCAGVVSGSKMDSVSLEFDRADFKKLFAEAGYTDIITLEGLESPVEVQVHKLDVNTVIDEIRHVEFYAIKRGVEMDTDVPLKLINEAPARKLDAVINQLMHEVSITCRPKDMIKEIQVDTSLLKEIGDTICVKDLVVPKTIKINLEPETMIMSVSGAKEEEKDEVEEESAETEAEDAGADEKPTKEAE